jgi:hypothetical protein
VIANGAQLAWLIDPQRKVVVIYRPICAPEFCEYPASIKGEGTIASFELPLTRVWD